MVLISIIMPVYNAGDTISISLDSLLMQGINNVELLIINDSSTDNSIDVILSYKEAFLRKGWLFKIINHDVNSGVAVARNSGLDNATGKYIYYVDADDYLDKNTLSTIVEKAEQESADIVGFNWYLALSESKRMMKQPNYKNNEEAIKYMLSGIMRWNLWIFLVKREIYELNNVRFIPGMNMGEDLLVTIKLFTFSEKVVCLDKALYFYSQSNSNSLTKVYSDKHMEEVSVNVKLVEDFLRRTKFASSIEDFFPILKLNIKLPLLISNKTDNYIKWQNWFSESNQYALKNNYLSKRIKFLQWAAWKGYFNLIRIHYYLIIRVVYGIIYK